MYQNELTHWGILGMKWGVRRYENPDGTLTEAGKKRYYKKEAKRRKEEEKTQKTEIKKQLKAVKKQRRKDIRVRSLLTDKELDQKINRLRKEKELKQLTDQDVNRGRNATKSAIATIGTKVISTAITGAALYGIKSMVSNTFNRQELGSAMFNGGAKKK